MEKEKYWVLMSRYLANDLSLQETDELVKWLDDDPARAELLTELKATWDKTSHYPANVDVDIDKGWSRVRQEISNGAKPARVETWAFKRLIAIAATVLLFLTIALLFPGRSGEVTVRTLAGENKKIVLPDGSAIWLNQLSELSYAKNFDKEGIRQVTMTGEAFFDVRHNEAKPFLITAGNTKTQVLGTSFNVKQDQDGSVSVAVVTGKVSFWPEGEVIQKLVLLPGKKGSYKKGSLAQTSFNNTNFLYWKSRQLQFENASVQEVLKTVETAYGVKFDVKNTELLKRKITTSFNHTSFAQVTDILEVLLDLKISKSGSVFVVENKK